MREWLWRLRAMWRRDGDAAARRDELQFHFDAAVDAARAAGLSPDEAHREARRRVGSVPAAEVALHEGIGVRWMDAASRDLRQAMRSLSHHVAFTTVAALVLCLSVGVATLLFALLDGVLLRPLPYRAPDRLFRVFDSTPTTPRFPMAIARYVTFRESARTLAGLALYTGRDMELGGDQSRSMRLTGVAVTTDFFSVLGWAPATGRAFTDRDLHDGVRTVILSDRLWRTRFGADPAIVGQVVRLNRESWTVIGVMPPGFQHVGGEYRSPPQGDTVDIWLPLSLDGDDGNLRASHFCNAIARIGEGRSLAEAQRELAALSANYSRAFSRFGTWNVATSPLLDEVTGRSRGVVTLLAWAALLVLAVACANIAGLCVARAIARRRDDAVRHALGAGRWARLRVALAENLLIGAVGGTGGLLLGAWAIPVLRAWLPDAFPRAHEVAFTWRSGAFALLVALLAVTIATALAAGATHEPAATGRVTTGRRTGRLRAVLVVVEIALAGVLCAGTIQLWRYHAALVAQDPGFRTAGVLTFGLTIPVVGQPRPGAIGARIEQLRTAIGQLPSVAAAGATTNLPWSGYDENADLTVVGERLPEGADDSIRYQGATPGFIEAAGLRLVAGRAFDPVLDAETRPLSILLNDAAVRHFFGTREAVGARVRVFGQEREVVGVVRGLRDHPTDPVVRPALWFPLTQVEFVRIFFAARAREGTPAGLVPDVLAAVQRVDPELPLGDVQSFEASTADALAAQRLALRLFQMFAVLTLVLAASGLYGLLAYLVHQRRKEFNIRAAVGATQIDLARVVLRESLSMAVVGAAICLLAIPVASAWWRALTEGLPALDAWAWVGAPAALLAIACLASLGPARTAARQVDGSALRED